MYGELALKKPNQETQNTGRVATRLEVLAGLLDPQGSRASHLEPTE